MVKCCIDCQGQKQMKENGMKITSDNGMEGKDNREMW